MKESGTGPLFLIRVRSQEFQRTPHGLRGKLPGAKNRRYEMELRTTREVLQFWQADQGTTQKGKLKILTMTRAEVIQSSIL